MKELDLTLEDKLYRTKYEPEPGKSHIKVNAGLCRTCKNKPCTFICPAKVYALDPNDEQLVIVSHENCLECGTCILTCPPDSIEWICPSGGMGVKYRFG